MLSMRSIDQLVKELKKASRLEVSLSVYSSAKILQLVPDWKA